MMLPTTTAILGLFMCIGCFLVLIGWVSITRLSEINDCHSITAGLPRNLEKLTAMADPWNLNDHNVLYTVSQRKDNQRKQNPVLPLNRPGLAEEGILYSKEKSSSIDTSWGPHKLGIIVPYRDRFEELKEFVPYVDNYLNTKKIKHSIFIVNQVDKYRFNRAALINVGFLVARNRSCDYVAMHDVDLLPLNKDLNYGYPEDGPFHVSGPNLHPKYHYKNFVGGILILSMDQFEKLNGLSTKFWGWGREDDEFYARMVDAGMEIKRHGKEITTGYDTFKHNHDKDKRKRDYARIGEQKRMQFKRDYETGLATIEYKVIQEQELVIDSHPCSILDVQLHCDIESTPWCNFPPKKKTKT